jgi:hypothetical protein
VKLSVNMKAIVTALMFCGLASLGAATSCHTGQAYAGGDLLTMDPSYESLMTGQLECWSTTTSQAHGLAATKDNVYKSFFNCTGDMRLDLLHWCACGIADDIDATTGAKTGAMCAMPCSSAEAGGKNTESRAGSASARPVVAVVGVAAILFAAGLL